MNGIFYENTRTHIPGWVSNLHESQALGYAYETQSHFVHFYGKNQGLNVISVGLTAVEEKKGLLSDWVKRVFGAANIKPLSMSIGETIESVWRPSLYYSDDIEDAINVDPFEQRSTEQALRILIEKLDEILLYLEPDMNGLKAFGHKSRELLILACTEIENLWTSIFKKSGIQPQNGRLYTTHDYIKLLSKACLNEFEIIYRNYDGLRAFQPFLNWTADQPTQSLAWYDAYNKTKHDRASFFYLATLENVMEAVAANVAMFCAKYGPFSLIHDKNTLSSLVNQHFDIHLRNSDPSTYYIPKIALPSDFRKDLFVYDCYKSKHNEPWIIQPLTL